MNFDDRQLLKGCLDGETRAREDLVHRFSNLIYSSILKALRSMNMTLSQHDIEDLHNTVFVQLFDHHCRKLRQYKGKNGCSLASWIRMITVRSVLDHMRRTKDALARPKELIPLQVIPDLEDMCTSVLDELETRDQYHMVEKALQALSPRDQLMIRMHCIEGCSLKQMALVLNVTENNVHSVKHRALQRIKAQIGQLLDAESQPA